jgi:methionyl-tRNA synthetase
MNVRELFYVTTPIYYVNDKPHVGHCYTTLVADCLARYHRARGDRTFFLTGTDEHSERVVSTAAEHGMTPMAWADRNAAAFREAFASLGFTNDDFIRTSEARHKEKVEGYVRTLMDQGDVYQGEYSGWWDHSQEEYLTETVARENDFKSPVTGKPLVKRTEKNYFFRLSKYEQQLKDLFRDRPDFVRPEARRNEVLGRLKDGLQDVPVSRAGGESGWGIRMPGDPTHVIYVWIDALFNYLSVVDTQDRRAWWPASVHLIAKDILWFHAVIWPALLMALGKELPGCVYAHSFWIREGRKMSKSLGNFIDMPTIGAYRAAYGDDALRWYLLTAGPLGATDSDFAHAKFIEVYNADLANGIGNAASRVTNMIQKYFDGVCPHDDGASSHAGVDWPARTAEAAARCADAMGRGAIDEAMRAALSVSNLVDGYVNTTEPFRVAKDESRRGELGTILANCAEALRIAAVLLSPAVPQGAGAVLRRLGQEGPRADGSFAQPLAELVRWGGLKAGTMISKGDPIYPRADAAAAPPAAG